MLPVEWFKSLNMKPMGFLPRFLDNRQRERAAR